MKRLSVLCACLLLCLVNLHATEGDSLHTQGARKMKVYHGPRIERFSVETRFGWQMNRINGVTDDDRTGFKSEYFNMYFFARLYKGLSFKWRQRLNITKDRDFWDCTDYMNLLWDIDRRWQVGVGKQVVAIGGYEYDRPAIDLYDNSEFWNQIPCFQLGAHVAYTFNSGDRLTFQVSQSPFRKSIEDKNTYGLSLMWNGTHGLWESIWSVNAFQTTGGRWINYIALGNRFNILPEGLLTMELDFINRASARQTFLFQDCSVVAEISTRPHSTLRIFGKYTYDVNRSGTNADLCVLSGTELHGIGGGVEYQPIKPYPDILRLFGTAIYNTGTQTNTAGTMQDGRIHVNVGFKVNLDILLCLRNINIWK